MKEAVDELNSIVSIFYSDAQSWLELADIYTSITDYKVYVQNNSKLLCSPPLCAQSAAVCLEEVVIIQSNSPLVHVRLAELYYTLGMNIICIS